MSEKIRVVHLGVGPPAVNSRPANVAVLKNSSKSRSWVTDFNRLELSDSVVYWQMSRM